MADPAEGGDVTANPTATPPAVAELVAESKSERELMLERQNTKQQAALKKLADRKREVEVANAHLTRENQNLKVETQATKQKLSWMGFGAN